MVTPTINREQIADKIAKELHLPRSRVRKIVLTLEEEIARELKTKNKVKLSEFGTFYLLNRKSRTIRQIRTLSNRVLLEHKAVKFKSSLKLKAKLLGRIFTPKTKLKLDSLTTPAKQAAPIPQPKLAMPTKPVKKFIFKPLRMMPPANKDRVHRLIRQRLQKLMHADPGKRGEIVHLPTSTSLNRSRSGKVFEAILHQTIQTGQNSFSFSLENSDIVNIYSSHPRKKMARLPKSTVVDFIERYFELHHLDRPQERFVKIKTNSTMNKGALLWLHSLPTAEGASVLIQIK